ncbi:MAG: hypothetical protein R3E87_06245 [Burkholderiaceae bacterium]
MKRQLPYFSVVALFALAIGTAPAISLAASSEIVELEPGDAAKVAREKIRQRGPNRLQALADDGSGGDSADCGSVNIGNQQDTSARGQINPRNQTTIITGNIFNLANCR